MRGRGYVPLQYPNILVKVAMELCEPRLLVSAKAYGTFKKLNQYAQEYTDNILIPKIKSDRKIYKPSKPFLRLQGNEVNKECIELFRDSLPKYVLKRIVLY